MLDLSDVREAAEPQGYLPVARQIQGQEELFGADFLTAPLPLPPHPPVLLLIPPGFPGGGAS